MRHKYRRCKMKPYCGWIRANKSGIRTCKILGPCPSWHRPAGVARYEFLATRRALKKAERQQARLEIYQSQVIELSDGIEMEDTKKSITEKEIHLYEDIVKAAKNLCLFRDWDINNQNDVYIQKLVIAITALENAKNIED